MSRLYQQKVFKICFYKTLNFMFRKKNLLLTSVLLLLVPSTTPTITPTTNRNRIMMAIIILFFFDEHNAFISKFSFNETSKVCVQKVNRQLIALLKLITQSK